MRELGTGLDPAVVALVDDRLVRVAEKEGVVIPWAIESGSRAWGFPSPDSDYDCRFIFVRPLSAYLDPWPPRDVIETPLDAVLDVSGWDLIKAVRLAENGNATVAEWLRSPIVYRGDPEFRDALLALCDALADRPRIGRHYLHVGRDHWARSGAAAGDAVALKRVFYALRPAAALRWMRLNAGVTPPMNLQQLFAESPPSGDVVDAVARLVAAKSTTRELGTGVVDAPIRRWVEHEFELAATEYELAPAVGVDKRAVAAEAFRAMLSRWSTP